MWLRYSHKRNYLKIYAQIFSLRYPKHLRDFLKRKVLATLLALSVRKSCNISIALSRHFCFRTPLSRSMNITELTGNRLNAIMAFQVGLPTDRKLWSEDDLLLEKWQKWFRMFGYFSRFSGFITNISFYSVTISILFILINKLVEATVDIQRIDSKSLRKK